VHAGHGEFPRCVIAIADAEDAFHLLSGAHNIAEKYQMPVILLSDLLLSEHTETVDPDELTNKVKIDRGEIVSSVNAEEYTRYQDTPSGVSPRGLPGTPGGMHIAASDEHDEDSLIISDIFTNPTARVKMMNKRMRKLDGVLKDTKPFVKEGPDTADLTLVGWGSTYNILREVRLALEKAGTKVNHVQFRVLWPFHSETALKELQAAKKTVCVENNFGGLFAKLVRQETGFDMNLHIRKYDGEPFYFEPLLEKVQACLGSGAPKVQSMITSELDIPTHRVKVTA
jgi:2-oxoglutarate ferredoxin oxidoreductase subunit alpha